jgi:hypothetical protein
MMLLPTYHLEMISFSIFHAVKLLDISRATLAFILEAFLSRLLSSFRGLFCVLIGGHRDVPDSPLFGRYLCANHPIAYEYYVGRHPLLYEKRVSTILRTRSCSGMTKHSWSNSYSIGPAFYSMRNSIVLAYNCCDCLAVHIILWAYVSVYGWITVWAYVAINSLRPSPCSS